MSKLYISIICLIQLIFLFVFKDKIIDKAVDYYEVETVNGVIPADPQRIGQINEYFWYGSVILIIIAVSFFVSFLSSNKKEKVK